MEGQVIDMSLQWVDKSSGKTIISGTTPGSDYLPVFMIEVQNKKHGLIVYRSTIPDFYVDVVSKFFAKNIGTGKIIVAVNDPDLLLLDFQKDKKSWEFVKTLAEACPYFTVNSSEQPYYLGLEYDSDAVPSEDLNIDFEEIGIEDLNEGRKGMTGGGGRGRSGKSGSGPPAPAPGPAPEPQPDPDKWVTDNPVSPKEGGQQGQGQGQGQGQSESPGEGDESGEGSGEGGEGGQGDGEGEGESPGQGQESGEGTSDKPGSCQECADNAEEANESMSDSDSPEDSMEKAKEAADNAKKAQEMARESNDEADKKAAEDARQSAEEAIEKAKQNVENNSSEGEEGESGKEEKLDELDQMQEDLKSDFEKGMEDIQNEMNSDSEDSEKDSDETFMKLMKKLYKLQPLAKTDEEFAELEILKMDIRKKFGVPVMAAAAENVGCECEFHPISTWECKPCWEKRVKFLDFVYTD